MKQMTAVRMALCSLFTALIAIGAFLQIPLPNFDYFTLQFFFVLMAGMLLGARLGALSAALYVLIGLLGIPVFAAGGGISYVLRPSFGFLLGFIVTAFCSGWIMEHGQKNWKTCFLAVLAGVLGTHGIGLDAKITTREQRFHFIFCCYPAFLWICRKISCAVSLRHM